MTLPCICEHAFQDKEYGRGNRVHNPRIKEGKFLGWRCTVCGRVQDGPAPEGARR